MTHTCRTFEPFRKRAFNIVPKFVKRQKILSDVYRVSQFVKVIADYQFDSMETKNAGFDSKFGITGTTLGERMFMASLIISTGTVCF